MSRTIAWVGLASLLFGVGIAQGGSMRFAADEPVWAVNDTLPIPEPDSRGWNLNRQLIDEQWLAPVDGLLALRGQGHAQDINSLEEVPASSWFTPRNGHIPVPPHLLEIGNARRPALGRGPYTVTEARLAGAEPYLLLTDSEGARYLCEFDEPDHPELRTGAAVIASRLLYAAGYNVLACFAAKLEIATLTAAPDARKIYPAGGHGKLSAEALEEFLAQLPGGRDEVGEESARVGAVRVAASRLPDGVCKGPFCDRGTRSDDPNDQIAHEDRRALRGLLALAAWLDHPGLRPDRTLDLYLSPQGYLRHYLIGLGATLGCVAGAPEPPDEATLKAQMATWRPRFPFRPFDRAQWSDLYWGLSLVLSFSDRQLGAAVRAARFGDEGRTQEVTRWLIARRDALGRAWLERFNGIGGFFVDVEGRGRYALAFEDLGVAAGLRSGEGVRYVMTYDNPDVGRRDAIQGRGGASAAFDLTPFVPTTDSQAWRYGIATIRAYDASGKRLEGETRVHIQVLPGEEPRIVGIERN